MNESAPITDREQERHLGIMLAECLVGFAFRHREEIRAGKTLNEIMEKLDRETSQSAS